MVAHLQNMSRRARLLPPISWHSRLQNECRTIERDIHALKCQIVTLLKDLHDVYESRDCIMRVALRLEREVDQSRNECEQLRRDNWRMQLDDANKNIEIVQLMQDVEMKRAKLDDMVEVINRFHTRPQEVRVQLRCECCYNEIDDDDECGPISCTRGHSFCQTCMETRCAMELNSLNPPKECLDCLADCTGQIAWNELTKCTGGIQYIGEVHGQRMLRRIVDMLSPIRPANDVLCKISLMRTDGSFRALQCPRCGWGPILHAHCSDLTTHHDETTVSSDGTEGHVSNACPRCHFLCAHVHEMASWNGETANGASTESPSS